MIRSTTVVGVTRDGQTSLAADGQVTFGEATILKRSARKVRRIAGGRVILGFAGSVADAQALSDRLEIKLDAHGGSLRRAAVEFVKDWRTDKILRQLNAMILAADSEGMLLLSGDGNVIEPDEGVAAIGSGGPYALAAARSLVRHTSLTAEAIARESLLVAAEICVYTNDQIIQENLPLTSS
ncbi:MAG TPA: ATP-dependent protease subunit HslV [Fimbriimonadaceae bacterium]|nr:ATP-dependent protease subunit HslV [Fimbriimonadaceae bacterium]HRJ32796.1 ATP-dependent protease subunit HslV [Fimbriimonadaceae bacterium]